MFREQAKTRLRLIIHTWLFILLRLLSNATDSYGIESYSSAGFTRGEAQKKPRTKRGEKAEG